MELVWLGDKKIVVPIDGKVQVLGILAKTCPVTDLFLADLIKDVFADIMVGQLGHLEIVEGVIEAQNMDDVIISVVVDGVEQEYDGLVVARGVPCPHFFLEGLLVE